MNPSINPMQIPRPKSLTGSFSSALQWSSISFAVKPPRNHAAKFSAGARTHNKVARIRSAAFFTETPDNRLWLSDHFIPNAVLTHRVFCTGMQRYGRCEWPPNDKQLDQATEFPGRVNCQTGLSGKRDMSRLD